MLCHIEFRLLVLELISPRAEEDEVLVQLFFADAVEVKEVEVLEDAGLEHVSDRNALG